MKKEFDRKLRKFLKRRGNLTLLANASGVSIPYLSLYASGKRQHMDIDKMERVWRIIK